MSDIQQKRRIWEALRRGDDETAELLLAATANPSGGFEPFGTWLHAAASFGRLRVVRFLLQAGANVNALGGTFGGTPLNEAASKGHLSVARFLLSAGADMETREPEVNPLFSAIYGGHIDIVRFLLAEGIDATVRYTGQRMKDMDAIAFARERGQSEIERFLTVHQTRPSDDHA